MGITNYLDFGLQVLNANPDKFPSRPREMAGRQRSLLCAHPMCLCWVLAGTFCTGCVALTHRRVWADRDRFGKGPERRGWQSTQVFCSRRC